MKKHRYCIEHEDQRDMAQAACDAGERHVRTTREVACRPPEALRMQADSTETLGTDARARDKAQAVVQCHFARLR